MVRLSWLSSNICTPSKSWFKLNHCNREKINSNLQITLIKYSFSAYRLCNSNVNIFSNWLIKKFPIELVNRLKLCLLVLTFFPWSFWYIFHAIFLLYSVWARATEIANDDWMAPFWYDIATMINWMGIHPPGYPRRDVNRFYWKSVSSTFLYYFRALDLRGRCDIRDSFYSNPQPTGLYFSWFWRQTLPWVCSEPTYRMTDIMGSKYQRLSMFLLLHSWH